MTAFFGRDTSCTTRLHTGRYATGARLVGEAAFRRITTPRGILLGGEDEKNYGYDLAGRIGSIASAADAAALPGELRAELLKDERIERVDVKVVRIVTGPRTKYKVTIVGFTGAGPFTLVVAASDVTVELLNLTAGG